jgi:hypothetical protein
MGGAIHHRRAAAAPDAVAGEDVYLARAESAAARRERGLEKIQLQRIGFARAGVHWD